MIALPSTSNSEPLTLPPAAEDAPAALPISSTATIVPAAEKKPDWKLPKNSSVRKTVIKIIALRTRGLSMAECATALGLSHNTVTAYMYKAGKNGWLENLDDPKDAIEYDVIHKVVRNLHEALDSSDEERRDKMTIEVAKGTAFKKFDPQQSDVRPALTMIAVRVETPTGEPLKIREGAIVGSPSFVEGQVVNGSDQRS